MKTLTSSLYPFNYMIHLVSQVLKKIGLFSIAKEFDGLFPKNEASGFVASKACQTFVTLLPSANAYSPALHLAHWYKLWEDTKPKKSPTQGINKTHFAKLLLEFGPFSILSALSLLITVGETEPISWLSSLLLKDEDVWGFDLEENALYNWERVYHGIDKKRLGMGFGDDAQVRMRMRSLHNKVDYAKTKCLTDKTVFLWFDWIATQQAIELTALESLNKPSSIHASRVS